MTLYKVLFYSLFLIVFSCNDNDTYLQNRGNFLGFKPIYMDTTNYLSRISSKPFRTIVSPGKLYIYNNYLFINELGTDKIGYGVHCYDNTDPESPQPISFIELPNCTDILIKNNTMYCQSPLGLVYFDIIDLNQVSDIKLLRNPKAIEIPAFPSEINGNRLFFRQKTYFECIDLSKGIVVGWKQENLNNPKCYK